MKKIFFLLFPLLLFFCELEAQSIDSTYLNIAVDTHNLKSAKQVNQYFLLIESYNNKLAPDTLLPYYRKALTSAQSFQIDTLAQKCALIIGQIHSNKGNLKKSRTYRELALTLAQKSQVTSLIANTYNHLGVQYILEGKIIEAVDIF